ncbi:MAG: MerR family transcriptional regulator [Deltaproteobacteria bacterium]|uniref:MerR family transcriptional regulator n=1 Tax=Acididesulfobacter guangdongensis TaxID=2597225 RepID=A0A519BHH3_ACIG2|nr:MerR family transcriptional regulator [Deltaproteobacteria bacterium]RZD16721.1 MAG: MerR family transcriptional regulator [Candidatus Acididesulfobacter guangdongensis]
MDWKDEKEKVYYKIGEVADILKVGTYVIRYWETEFKFIKPLKLNSSHRLYSKKEIEKLLVIKDLLYDKKFTIKGARNALKSGFYKLTETNADAANNDADTSKCPNSVVSRNNQAAIDCVPFDSAENNSSSSCNIGPDITDIIDIKDTEDRNKNQIVYADCNGKASGCAENSGRINVSEIIEELKIIKNILFQNIHK